MNASCPPFPLAEDLRLAMRAAAGGVSIVTVGHGSERTGMTVTSALSLSMAPPTMLVAIDRRASSWLVFREADHFAVNIPSAEQALIAERFAGRGGHKGAQRYAGADWVVLGSGTLGLCGALAIIECRVEERIERQDHALMIGAVTAVHRGPGGAPLIHVAGQFASAAPLPVTTSRDEGIDR